MLEAHQERALNIWEKRERS